MDRNCKAFDNRMQEMDDWQRTIRSLLDSEPSKRRFNLEIQGIARRQLHGERFIYRSVETGTGKYGGDVDYGVDVTDYWA